MKIAALYDIHGNLPALNAVLEELKEIQPDLIIAGGDILPGPFPGQTLERLLHSGYKLRSLRGNGDREVVMAFDGQPFSHQLPEIVLEQLQWVASQLPADQRDFLASLPEQITLEIAGLGEILFCHATPRNDEEIFTPLTSQERLATIFSSVKQQIVVCGHTHIQFEQQVGSVRVVNAGSVGMPYADRPGAYWLLLTPQGYEFRRTDYDTQVAAEEIKASAYPQAQKFAEENVLTLPTATEAAEFFEGLIKQS